MNKENISIIKALNMYGRVPEQWELLEEIERLNNIIEKVINILELSAQNKGICTCIETDTIQSALKELKEGK